MPDIFDDEDYRRHLATRTPEEMLRELLSVIHRDGGHYTGQHGLATSVADAMEKWYRVRDLLPKDGENA